MAPHIMRTVERRRRYRITMQVGVILSLSVLIGLVNAPIESREVEPEAGVTQAMITIVDVPLTIQKKEPPVPPRPLVPVEVANDELLEFDELNIDHPVDILLTVPANPPTPPADADAEASDSSEPFFSVEEMPAPIGGMAALHKAIRYPDLARRAQVEGTVTISFVVDEKGDVSEATVVKGIGAGCDEEALRAVLATKFSPGRQRGNAVRVRMSLPVRFRLR